MKISPTEIFKGILVWTKELTDAQKLNFLTLLIIVVQSIGIFYLIKQIVQRDVEYKTLLQEKDEKIYFDQKEQLRRLEEKEEKFYELLLEITKLNNEV